MSDERSATAFDKALGQRVRTRRREIGMTQVKLAAKLRVTFQQVQKYEKGKNRIAVARLADIAAALDAPISHLMPPTTQRADHRRAVRFAREARPS
jgi:transcriptional regulator with XRE-family HTH domain